MRQRVVYIHTVAVVIIKLLRRNSQLKVVLAAFGTVFILNAWMLDK